MTSHVESVSLGRYVDESLDQEDARATTIALYQEGALEQEDAEFVQSHLAECTECAEVFESLREVASVLDDAPIPPLDDELLERIESSAPAPEDAELPPLPADTADLIDTALEAERERHTASEREGDQNFAQILPLAPASRSRRWTPYILVAAAAVFLFGGGFAGVTALLSKGEEAGGLPPNADTTPLTPTDDPEAALPYHPEIVESGTTYTGADFGEDAVALAQRATADSDGAAAEGPSPSFPEQLLTCVHELGADSGHYPVLIDLAEYEGESAWVLVYEFDENAEDAADDQEYLVQAVPTTCGSDDAPEPEILDSTTVSRD